MDWPKMRAGMELNEMVSVEMPAHLWVSFIAAYSTTEWSCGAATAIMMVVQEKLLDPLFLNEKQAEMQQHMDQQRAELRQWMTGQEPPPPPPGFEGLPPL